MSAPTVRGKPSFNTSGYHAKIYVMIDNDPPPGVTATYLRAWGESSVGNKTCFKYNGKGGAKPKIDEAAGLPNAEHVSEWLPFDHECEYYRICAEVTLSNGEKVYTCYVWKAPTGGNATPPYEVLADC